MSELTPNSSPIHIPQHEYVVELTPPEVQMTPQSSNPTKKLPMDPPNLPSEQTSRRSENTKTDTFIWLSNININNIESRFENFLTLFKETGKKDFKYLTLIEELHMSQETVLNIDCSDMYTFDKSLYKNLVEYPQEIIPIMDLMINNLYFKKFEEKRPLTVRTYKLKEVKHMRGLGPEDIDHLVCLRGMVTRVSEIIPDIKMGLFRCVLCDHEKEVFIDRGRIDEPAKCESCLQIRCLQLIHNRSAFSDKQIVKLQETPETIPEGETPHTVNLCVFDSLVDIVKPGDRVDVTGVYRAISARKNPKQRQISTIFRNYIDVIHFQKTGMRMNEVETSDESLFSLETNTQKISKEDEKKIKELAKSPDIYEKLTYALAPSIYKMDDVKKGILCQLFGGVNKITKNGKIRGEIHVLMMGDPGVSKSQLLIYVNKIAPRGIYTSGKGSSAVGLTAYVTKDKELGEFVLESGALVLSDLGVCCIDEFDKMSDTARSILHEVMEQQTVSIAKAGIICSLNARTSILAAANPKESKYNESLSIVENIQLPPTLLSRFDFIFLLKDVPDKQRDRKLAKHLISLFQSNHEVQKLEIDTKLLTLYIAYAKMNINPEISDEASDTLVKGYLDLRRLGSNKKQITATTRQLESLIRISESLARMRLSNKVEKDDVIEALRLIKVSIFKAAIDPRSGEIDIDLLNTGQTRDARENIMKEMENTD